MTAKMEEVRKALDCPYRDAVDAHMHSGCRWCAEVEPAFAEVEEWEAARHKADLNSEGVAYLADRAEAAEAEVYRLTNKLNADSQNFELLSRKSENELLRTDRDRYRQALSDIASPRMLKSRDDMVGIAREALDG